MKSMNALKTKYRPMRQVFLNAHVYTKHKINLTWPKK